MLKITGVEIEKISDTDMHLFLENRLSREISYSAKSYAKANKKYMKDYGPTKPSIYIPQLDMNNSVQSDISSTLI